MPIKTMQQFRVADVKGDAFPSAMQRYLDIIRAKIDELSSFSRLPMAAQMTTDQRDAIVSPPDGLFIYNTTSKQFEGFSDGSWVAL